MIDNRIRKMAEVLVNYSLKLKKGDTFIINADYTALPLVKEVYREALKAGAYPETSITADEIRETYFKNANDDQLEHVGQILELMLSKYDAVLTISSESNTKHMSNIDPAKISKSRAAQGELFTGFLSKMASGEIRWCGTQFPTNASAQDAEMSLEEYEDFVFSSCYLNTENPAEEWKKISDRQEKLVNVLNTKKELHIVSKDTDISMIIEDRKWINCDGQVNFPDGEIYTTPIKNSVNGHIRYTYPAVYGGREVEDVKLIFKDGKVVEASAGKGQEYLKSVLDTDEGARYLGEVAIGTNYGIDKFTKNILFDEKIGGTVHLALGAALPETGGKNDSAIHWDMICDMHEEGKIFADGELIYENGEFLI